MFQVSSKPPIYYAGVDARHQQVLLGWYRDTVLCVQFSDTGVVSNIFSREIDFDFSTGLGPKAEEAAKLAIERMCASIGFQEGTICIKEFSLSIGQWQIGLHRHTDDMIDYLLDPSAYSKKDARIYEHDIKQWEYKNNCVLEWQDQYYLNSDGYTI